MRKHREATRGRSKAVVQGHWLCWHAARAEERSGNCCSIVRTSSENGAEYCKPRSHLVRMQQHAHTYAIVCVFPIALGYGSGQNHTHADTIVGISGQSFYAIGTYCALGFLWGCQHHSVSPTYSSEQPCAFGEYACPCLRHASQRWTGLGQVGLECEWRARFGQRCVWHLCV